jgi:hypothetical protein
MIICNGSRAGLAHRPPKDLRKTLKKIDLLILIILFNNNYTHYTHSYLLFSHTLAQDESTNHKSSLNDSSLVIFSLLINIIIYLHRMKIIARGSFDSKYLLSNPS